MIYLNLETHMLHSPEYIGSDPTARGTWLNVNLWCAQQENKGRIVGAITWKDRQWQQTCGVTVREVARASKLLVFEGEDLLVWGYPQSKEAEVQAKREAGRTTARKRWNKLSSSADSYVDSSATSSADTEWNGRERKGKEGNGKASNREASRFLPPNLDTPGFRLAWESWLVHWADSFNNAKPIPNATADSHLSILTNLGAEVAIESLERAIAGGYRSPRAPFPSSEPEKPRLPDNLREDFKP